MPVAMDQPERLSLQGHALAKRLLSAKSRLTEHSATDRRYKMKKPRRTTSGILVILLGVAVSVSTYVWSTLTGVFFENDPAAYAIHTMRPIYESVSMASVHKVADIREAISNPEIVGASRHLGESNHFVIEVPKRYLTQQPHELPAIISANQFKSLLDQVAELIYFRLVSDDPQRYFASRAKHHAISLDGEELHQTGWGTKDNIFQFFLGRPAHEEETLYSLIETRYNDWKSETGQKPLNSVANTSKGVACALGIADDTFIASASLDDSSLGWVAWNSSAAATGGVLLFSENTIAEHIQKYTTVQVAQLGVVAGFGNIRQSVVFEFFWDRDLNDWSLSRVLFLNRKGQSAKNLPQF